MNDEPNPDGRRSETDPLLDDLRALFAQDDPVPSLVVETAKASLGWRRLDADLAELLSDSALEAPYGHALARGQAQIRSVSLAADQLTIDMEVLGEGPDRRILGQLSPAVTAAIELQVPDADAPRAAAVADELGRFQLVLPEVTAVRLRFGISDPRAPDLVRWTETSWIVL